MQKQQDTLYANVTVIDVQLASAYYPILVAFAKDNKVEARLTYGDLVALAKEAYPEQPVVQNAIAVSTGRRLDVVRLFTSERGLPDLTSLVINKGTGECGAGFTRAFDPNEAREKVFDFDWSTVKADFDGFVKATEVAIKPRKPVSKPIALERMATYYKEHKDKLPATIREKREQLVELLMEGFTDEEAFTIVLQDDQA